MKINKKKVLYYILGIFIVFIISIVIISFYVLSFSKNLISNDINSIKNIKVGLVLGASVKGNRTPSNVLKDRLNMALKAYKNKKILKIILSGDNGMAHYNEPVTMQKFLLKAGVNKNDLYLDYAGFNTYDSIYRARDIFGIKKIVIFTQKDHLKRAIYISKRLGLDSYGINTGNLPGYLGIRELLARVKAFLEVEILKSKPKFLGDKINIKFETPEELKLRNINVLIDLQLDNSIQKFVNNKVSFKDIKYIPNNLVDLNGKFILDLKGYGKLRKQAKNALNKMSKDFYLYFGKKIKVVSSYRSYIYQKGIKDRGCPDNLCAKPGYSEHQSGLAIDLWEASNEKEFLSNSKYKKYFIWLNKNAYKYGFSNTYQKGLKVDGYEIEPWHWRYLGIPFASYLNNKNITIAQFYFGKL